MLALQQLEFLENGIQRKIDLSLIGFYGEKTFDKDPWNRMNGTSRYR